ncbi:hypothetical protein A4X09_0g7597 [Tilletia walkeri]|uniref:Extracellular membrane protein CFEM domain-containing protein n=1 Tax=Tilletia walkeri TaxID=117179 RepID=A0A8X7N1L9_9BASI|nr:hypothetical protein A4X09_0g7597 [Tilletia walkeri]
MRFFAFLILGLPLLALPALAAPEAYHSPKKGIVVAGGCGGVCVNDAKQDAICIAGPNDVNGQADQGTPQTRSLEYDSQHCYCIAQTFADQVVKCLAAKCPESYDTTVAAIKSSCNEAHETSTINFPDTLPSNGTTTPPSGSSSNGTNVDKSAAIGAASPNVLSGIFLAVAVLVGAQL